MKILFTGFPVQYESSAAKCGIGTTLPELGKT